MAPVYANIAIDVYQIVYANLRNLKNPAKTKQKKPLTTATNNDKERKKIMIKFC